MKISNGSNMALKYYTVPDVNVLYIAKMGKVVVNNIYIA